MGIKHPKLIEWEDTLKQVFDDIDDYLEDKYGSMYPLHPVRAKRGTTASKQYDGLFNVGAAFTSGFGSEHGAGYVVEVRMATLSSVSREVHNQVERDVLAQLNEKLPVYFPDRELAVERDGSVFKICGDLSLD